jgi:predicted RNase H-like HicB family nuclease
MYIETKATNMEKGKLRFTLEYWEDGGWIVGRLREAPWVFSQGKDYVELVENIVDAYKMMYRTKKGILPVRQYKSKSVAFAL